MLLLAYLSPTGSHTALGDAHTAIRHARTATAVVDNRKTLTLTVSAQLSYMSAIPQSPSAGHQRRILSLPWFHQHAETGCLLLTRTGDDRGES